MRCTNDHLKVVTSLDTKGIVWYRRQTLRLLGTQRLVRGVHVVHLRMSVTVGFADNAKRRQVVFVVGETFAESSVETFS